MRLKYDPAKDTEIATAEALQEIARQLDRMNKREDYISGYR